MKFRIGQYLDFSQKFQALRPAGLYRDYQVPYPAGPYRDYQVLYLAAVIDIAVAPGISWIVQSFCVSPSKVSLMVK